MFYFPVGPGPYEAISFPQAEDMDGDGLLEKDADGMIDWTETVIYHIWPSTPHQLRKTVFKPRDNSLSDAQRQAQLDSVVKLGHGNNTYNSANVSSSVIFENLLDWQIIPKEGRFDAYAPTVERDIARLGYALLDPGVHEFEFRLIDKNDSSSGYKLGIDQLVVSPSYSEREGEAQLPPTRQAGAAASIQYMSGGSWKGNHQLLFPATGAGNSLTLTLDNDRWEETNFDGIGYATENTIAKFDKSITPRDHVVCLSGNEVNWSASERSATLGASTSADALQGATIDIHLRGSDLLNAGVESAPHCKFTLQAGTAPLRIDNIEFGQSDSLVDMSFNRISSVRVKDPNGSESWAINPGVPVTSRWVPYEITKTNNYVLSYTLQNGTGAGCATYWPDKVKRYRLTLPNGFSETNNVIFGLSEVRPSFPGKGTFTSQVFDTHMDAPVYKDISWDAIIPVGTALAMKVRTGNQSDLSDAPAWDSLTEFSAPRSVSAPYKRYIQFQTLLESNGTHNKTPCLQDVTINWTGEKSLVDIGGIFTKGPDYGVFEIRVDGEPLRSAIIVDLEIFKDTFGLNKTSMRLTSQLQTDITPRNTGL
jgi:hypothetical protein